MKFKLVKIEIYDLANKEDEKKKMLEFLQRKAEYMNDYVKNFLVIHDDEDDEFES